MTPSGTSSSLSINSVSGPVLRRVPGGGARRGAPARAAALIERLADRGGVPAETRDHGVGMALVGVDRDPLADAGRSPAAGKRSGGHRGPEQSRGMQDIAHRAGAVVA